MRLITRGGYNWTSRYPWIVEAARKVRQKQFVLDGRSSRACPYKVLGIFAAQPIGRSQPPSLKATPDITIEELRDGLSKKGLSFGYGTIRRFFERHQITRKKKPPMPQSKLARTS